jgi:hypothetical protein
VLTICLHDQIFHAFHLCGETRFQPPPPFPITTFIGIGKRPDTHECSRRCSRLLQVNPDASRPHISSSVKNMNAFGLGTTSLHHIMRPRTMTWGSYVKFEEFTFRESLLYLIQNIPMLASAKKPIQIDGRICFESNGKDAYSKTSATHSSTGAYPSLCPCFPYNHRPNSRALRISGSTLCSMLKPQIREIVIS